ncbi:hypothetical protein ACPC54_17105 [Kitasatospora sp. NPDC094028]
MPIPSDQPESPKTTHKRRTAKRVYGDPAESMNPERPELPPGWRPLDDYREANYPGRVPSVGTLLQNAAVQSTCPCHNCVARRRAE